MVTDHGNAGLIQQESDRTSKGLCAAVHEKGWLLGAAPSTSGKSEDKESKKTSSTKLWWRRNASMSLNLQSPTVADLCGYVTFRAINQGIATNGTSIPACSTHSVLVKRREGASSHKQCFYCSSLLSH
jgi:hypothetical protein